MDELQDFVHQVAKQLEDTENKIRSSVVNQSKLSALQQKKLNPLTVCDVGKEDECRKFLCKFIEELSLHYQMVKDSIKRLDELAERLWVLATRYCILESGKPFYQIYPEVITKHVICEMTFEKKDIMTQICIIIHNIMESFSNTEKKQTDFLNSSKLLDWNVPSSFIMGDERQKPLEYYINGANDLLFYFHVHQSTVKRRSMEITLDDCNSMKEFQKCLPLDEYFLTYLNALINYSRCLAGQNTCEDG